MSDQYNTEIELGYRWPDHQNEGNDLSAKIINSISNKDMKTLKSVFCKKTLDSINIDQQIQDAFNFFKGTYTQGKVKGLFGTEYVDGNHDYHTTVSDNETVQNHEPTSTSIFVVNKNIQTDIGKTYQVEFYAYLLNNNEKAFEGVSQIKIINDKGDKFIIGKKVD